MKALLSLQPGGPGSLVLEDIPQPENPGTGELIIAVKAVGVNFPDTLIIEDMYQFKPSRPFSPGGEVAGIVQAVGAGVTGFTPGMRVIGSCGWGGMRETLVIAADRCIPIPENMPFDEAAALIMTYGTSYYALKDRADPKPGETLLVLGAAGGVGIAAIEIGKTMGLRVIAACSSEEKCDFCRSKGADEALVYERAPLDRDQQKALSAQIKALVPETGIDIVYDAAGGDYAEPAIRALGWKGRFLVIGFPAGIPKIPLNLALLKSCDIRGVFWGAAVARDPAGNQRNIADLLALYDAGKIRPHVSARFPLAQGGQAIAHLKDRKAMGKVIVTV